MALHSLKSVLARVLPSSLRAASGSTLGSAHSVSRWMSNVADIDTNLYTENRQARLELAAAYRISERLNLHEGICNHLSLLAPAQDGSGTEVMLIIPYGLHWREVTASSLLGISTDGQVVEGAGGQPESTAFHIHNGVRSLVKHKCILHLHPPYSTALACLKDPRILLCHQTAIRFYNKIAYDTGFGGYGDNVEEGSRLARELGDKEILMMGNHGVLSASASVAEGIDALYYLERLAMSQVLALSTGQELSLISEEIVAKSAPYLVNLPQMAKQHFDSLYRVLQKECPDFAE